MNIRIYAQGTDEIMQNAERIVVNTAYEPLKKYKRWNKPCILDNGAFQGKTATPEQLVKIAEKINPELIIAPDVRFDSKASLRLTLDYAAEINDKWLNKSIAVFRPEPNEFQEHLDKIYDAGFKWLAFPSGENINYFKGRFRALIDEKGFKLHVLGAQDGTWTLLTQLKYHSIDFVSQDINEFKHIVEKIKEWSIIL